MKVYQIISENWRTELADVLLKHGAGNIDQVLGFLARAIGRNKLTAKEIAESWVTISKKTDWPIEDIILMGERQLVTAGVDRAIIDAAIKEAAKFQPGLLGRIAAKLKSTRTKTATVKTAFGDFLDVTSGVLYKLAVWEPVAEVAYNVGNEYLDYKAGKITEAQFKNNSQYWLNDGVGKVAAALVGNAILASGWGAVGTLIKPLAGLANVGNQVTQSALNAWLLTDHGRECLAWLIMGDTFGRITGPNGEQLPLLKFIRDAAGGWITKGISRAKEAVQTYTNPQAAAAAKAQRDAEDAKNAAEWKKLPSYTPGMELDKTGRSIKTGPNPQPL
jgi:hypothetical protein